MELPQDIAREFCESQHAEVYSLRPGLLMACSPSAKKELFSEAAAAPKKNIFLSSEEQALISKISRIRFSERTCENVDKITNDSEKKALEGLIGKKLIYVLKSSKYPKGVYNIPTNVFYAHKNQASPRTVRAPSANFNANAISGPALAINTVEHLKKLGYMVLSNEAEAKYQMQNIKNEIKDDDVKGVRGFDKKYYILRKSFLHEFKQPIFELLDEGLMSAKDMSEKLKLTSEAITVVLMVMADEGLVIEKRKGKWAKA